MQKIGIFLLISGWLIWGCQTNSEIEEQTSSPQSQENFSSAFPPKQVLNQQETPLKTTSEKNEKEHSAVLADFYYHSAKKSFEEGRFRNAFELACFSLKEDPNHSQAQKLRQDIAKAIEKGGEAPHREDLEITFQELVQLEKVRIQQAQMEIRQQILFGQEKMNQKKYDQAIRHFENALQMIRWMPYPMDATIEKEQLSHLMGMTKEKQRKEKDPFLPK